MRASVISLPSRTDRRAQFSAWNARPRLDIAFIDAVVGASLDRRALHAQGLVGDTLSTFSPGALGNAFSHHALWRETAQQNETRLICEDDACLRGDFVDQAEALLASLPSGWDICFLGYNTNAALAAESAEGLKAIVHFDESIKQSPGFFDRFSEREGPRPVALKCFQAWGTLCYAVTPAGAAKLLKLCFPLTSAPDIVMFAQNRTLKPFTLDSMINLALQREDVGAWCAYPPLALSANDRAGSDVVS